MPTLAELAAYMDELLSVSSIPDYPNALNGIQLANRGTIQHVACAVDFSSETIHGAVDVGAKLLIVHHGMFWGGVQPLTAHRYSRLRDLIENDVAVYSAHLPLDLHADIGNNALLAKYLGLEASDGFARFQSIDVGLSGVSEVSTQSLAELAAKLATEYHGSFTVTPFARSRMTRRWGICTGAGADSGTLREAVQRRLDTLVVGEGPHHTAIEARELGIVVIYAGHYATETLGVRALGARLQERFGVTSTFVDAPSGL